MEHGLNMGGDWLSWSPESLARSAWAGHIPLAAWLVERIRPKLSVELGAGEGASFRPLCQIMDRFSPGGRLVGIDPWRPDTGVAGPGGPANRQFAALQEYCRTHHADTASLLRSNVNAAAGEFESESIDFLHVADPGAGQGDSQVEVSAWMPKLRPGGVVLITCGDGTGDSDAAAKLWQRLRENWPSTAIGLPTLTGLIQVPDHTGAPLVDALASTSAASTLFRSLGERIEYRHILGPAPVSPASALRLLHRSECERRELLTAKDRELAMLAERLQEQSAEMQQLRDQVDVLLARLASQAAAHERQTAALKKGFREDLAHAEMRFTTAVAELSARYVAESTELRSEIARRDAHITAVSRTLSWRVTGPLRKVQSFRLRLTRRSN